MYSVKSKNTFSREEKSNAIYLFTILEDKGFQKTKSNCDAKNPIASEKKKNRKTYNIKEVSHQIKKRGVKKNSEDAEHCKQKSGKSELCGIQIMKKVVIT